MSSSKKVALEPWSGRRFAKDRHRRHIDGRPSERFRCTKSISEVTVAVLETVPIDETLKATEGISRSRPRSKASTHAFDMSTVDTISAIEESKIRHLNGTSRVTY